MISCWKKIVIHHGRTHDLLLLRQMVTKQKGGRSVDLHIGQAVLPLGRKRSGGMVSLLGTCFAVHSRQFATAAHVTGPSDDGLVAIVGRNNKLTDYQDTTDTKVKTVALKIANYDPIHDTALLEVVDNPYRASFDYTIGSTDQIFPGTPVVSLGYPHADHGRLVLTQQVSVVGARVLLGVGGLKIKHVVLNALTRPGQSGGPVFTADGSKVCGMIVGGYVPSGTTGSISLGGIDPQTLHQTTHVISSEYIARLL